MVNDEFEFDEDDVMSPTLNDVYELGNEDARREVEDLAREIAEEWSWLDQNNLAMVRRGGHTVHVHHDRLGTPEVQIDNYRTGPRYGHWSLVWSPEGTELSIEQHHPEVYQPDGTFDTTVLYKAWVLPRDAWLARGETILGGLLGKRLAREATELLSTPSLAPDAR